MIWRNILLYLMELLFINGINLNSLLCEEYFLCCGYDLLETNHLVEQMFAEHAGFVQRPCARDQEVQR